jgi:aspartate/methionine/tyrosine aminotransferase
MRFEPSPIPAFFDRWGHLVRQSFSDADIEPLSRSELLAMADDETRALWEALTFEYSAGYGNPLLRAEIAAWTGMRPEDILTFAGTSEAIFVAANVLLRPGDHAIVPTPAFPPLAAVPRACGADVTLLPLDAGAGWGQSPDALRAAIRPETRLVVLNAPHNPTGALPNAGGFRETVEIVEEAGAWLLCDEVFRGLELDPTMRLPSAATLSPRAVSVGGMSKAFGLSGLRVGWAATTDHDLLSRMAGFKSFTSMSNSAPSEILSLMALRNRAPLLARARDIMAVNLQALDGFFETRRESFDWVRPLAGAVAFPRLRRGGAGEFAVSLLEREGILVLPGELFHGPRDSFRIGFGRRSMPAILERVQAFLSQAPPT